MRDERITRLSPPSDVRKLGRSARVQIVIYTAVEKSNMKKPAAALRVSAPLVAALIGPPPAGQTAAGPQPPVARRQAHVTEIHGYTLKDDYFWLREKSNPEVLQYLEAENAYTEEVMGPTKELQETLYKEMLGRIKQTDLSVPSARRLLLLLANRGREAVPLHVPAQRQHGRAGGVLLDLNALAEGHRYLGLGAYAVSDDGDWLAYSTDTTGYRQYTLRIKDLRTGEMLPERSSAPARWSGRPTTRRSSTPPRIAVSKRSDRFWRHVAGAAGQRARLSRRRTSCSTSAPAGRSTAR